MEKHSVTRRTRAGKNRRLGKMMLTSLTSPIAFVVLKPIATATTEEIRGFANERPGKMQRLAGIRMLASLPRSPIGKV